MSGTIQPKSYFTQTDLRNIRQAVDGASGAELFKSAPEQVNDGTKDVLIMAPEGGDLFASAEAKDANVLADNLSQKGVEVTDSLDNIGVAAKVSPEKLAQLEDQGYKVFDNSPRQMLPDMPAASTLSTGNSRGSHPWDMPIINPAHMLHSDVVNQAGFTGKGQVVAVLDSGFDHADYNNKLAFWKDEVNSNAQPHDGAGHGTHVVGDILQTAPDAQIAAIKVMGDDGKGRPSDIIRGLQDVLKLKSQGMNINLVNMSLGGQSMGQPHPLDPIDKAVEQLSKAGISVIAAAGNSGPGNQTIGSPADSPSAIAIGAALNEHTVSDFSSRGPTDNGLDRPDVTAPGEFIVSWGVPGTELYQTAQVVQKLRDMPGDQLKKILVAKPQLAEALGVPPEVANWDPDKVENTVKPKLPPVYFTPEGNIAAPGTSFASPLTAGVAADLEQAKKLSPDQMKAVLSNSADNMGAGWDKLAQGHGFVNAEKALHQVAG